MHVQAWGQPLNTASITAYAERVDPSRLFMSATGWANTAGQLAGSFVDVHDYAIEGPTARNITMTQGKYISTVGEMGGISLNVQGHSQFSIRFGPSFQSRTTSPADFVSLYSRQVARMLEQARDPQIALSAAVFTELSDVQFDITGITTYDRRVVKVNVTAMAVASRNLIASVG